MLESVKLYALLKDPNYKDLKEYEGPSYTVFNINHINDALDKIAYRVVLGYFLQSRILYRFNNPRRPLCKIAVPDSTPLYMVDLGDKSFSIPREAMSSQRLIMGEQKTWYTISKELVMKFIYNGHLIEIKELTKKTFECTCNNLVLFKIETTDVIDLITKRKVNLLTMYEHRFTALQENPGNSNGEFEVNNCDLKELLILMAYLMDDYDRSTTLGFFCRLTLFLLGVLVLMMVIILSITFGIIYFK